MNGFVASLSAAVTTFALGAGAALAQAQVPPPNVAVPFYAPPAFMQGLHKQWYAPRAADFATEAAALPTAIDALCNADAATGAAALQQARTRWQSSALAFDRLSAVAIGPLVQRRSLRQIDFWPTRPELITRAITAAPADAKAMERIGTPAKGFPALEWLLWTQPAAPGTPACRYAQRVALEIDDEAKALSQAFAALAARDWADDEEAASAAMSEVVNQWVGGLERLRWARMEKPLRSAGAKSATALPRAASGATLQSWAAQWDGLRAIGVTRSAAIPVPGQDLVPLEMYLRGRGLNPLSNKLAQNAAQVTQQIQGLQPGDSKRTLDATRSLSAMKRLTEAEVAPALEINIGFSDADGD
ncbi:MAG: imelysin family protein [Polaromonas sp.]|nr:imelysin family protein [Polaromonas sp.]